jgi:hypothetical protein
MDNFGKVVLTVMIALSALCLVTPLPAQEPVKSPTQAPVSDGDLKAFAKAYVDYHRIRKQYEPALSHAKEVERKKIQDEANGKLRAVLVRHRLTPESYNRIFKSVNGDEKLRKQALKLIEEERNNS